MRWSEPKVGDDRVKEGFLWEPLCIGDETRWLERASWQEVWQWVGTNRQRACWLPVRWLS